MTVTTLTALLIASGNYRLAGFVFFGSILIALISRVFFVATDCCGATADRRDTSTLLSEATSAAGIATDAFLLAIGMSVILFANAQNDVLRAVKFVALSLMVTFLVSLVRKSGMQRKSRGA